MTETTVRRQNEFIVIIGAKEFKTDYLYALQSAATPGIRVDRVQPLRTPYGTMILLVTASSTWKKTDSWRLREWLFGNLKRVGYSGEMNDIVAPNRMRRYRAQ